LADRFALFGYGPVVCRKPFGPHLAVGALSCMPDAEDLEAKGARQDDDR